MQKSLPNQKNITDFMGDISSHDPLTLEERKKIELDKKVKGHLREVMNLILESEDNWINYDIVSNYLRDNLNELEKSDICYYKTVKGQTRIYKKLYCCYDKQKWKQCPTFYCPAMPCNEDSILRCLLRYSKLRP